MQNHPIPQQISSYQFRLVGDMTLKQFFQVGSGALVALLLYSSSLPVYIKWPLLVLSFLFGVALAFFPLEDRPLSKWIFLFAKSIYAPTLYVWMKNYQKPQYFQPEQVTDSTGGSVLVPQPQTQSVQSAPELEKSEQQFLSNVSKQLQTPTVTLPTPEPTGVITEIIRDKEEVVPEPTPVLPEVKAPEVPIISVEKTDKSKDIAAFTQPAETQGVDINDYHVTPLAGQQTQNTATAQFSPDAAPPTPPTRENVIVGQVMDSQGKIVENAILEIKDEEGRPVRALKSNRLGHFMIVTPLINGKYDMITEKDGLEFEPITFVAAGEILPPIAIRAKQNN